MVEIDENTYKKIQKDASDNRSILRLVRLGLLFVFLIIILFIYGTKFIDISLMKYRTFVECQSQIIQAENNVRIREIESTGMTTEEYLKWLEVRE